MSQKGWEILEEGNLPLIPARKGNEVNPWINRAMFLSALRANEDIVDSDVSIMYVIPLKWNCQVETSTS